MTTVNGQGQLLTASVSKLKIGTVQFIVFRSSKKNVYLIFILIFFFFIQCQFVESLYSLDYKMIYLQFN